MLAVSTALAIQAFFFGDGGITALGANCFNIAIVGSLTAFGVYRLLAGGRRSTRRGGWWLPAWPATSPSTRRRW